MNHDEAIREQAVERYLLGELPEDARARFEEHFFDCDICASDLKTGAAFIDGLRADPRPISSPQPNLQVVPKRPRAALLRPWLVPALAASLLVVAYQNIMVLPNLRRTVAIGQAPAVMNNVILANIDARGADVPKITAPAHGSFLISVDIPSGAEYSSYLCLLYNSSGQQLLQMPITAQQVENTVSLRVPTDKAASGSNELRVMGIPSTGASPVEVGRYRFSLQVSP
jgi:putative zinc finger protein